MSVVTSFITATYRKFLGGIAIVDLLTAVVYGVVALAVLTALGMWWLFFILAAVLICASALRGWAKARAGARHS